MNVDHTGSSSNLQVATKARHRLIFRLGLVSKVTPLLAKLSLSKRMFISSALVVFTFIGASALVLHAVFTISLENIVQEKLTLHTYQLISVGDSEDGALRLPQALSEPRFNQTQGALIAFVTEINDNNQQQEIWRSISATDKRFSFPAPDSGQWIFGRAQGNSENEYYTSSYTTTWSEGSGESAKYVFTVMEDLRSYQEPLSRYRLLIAIGLFVFGLVFLLLQTIILRLGLSPVRRIAADVEAMNRGENEQLSGQYPEELKLLTTNLNRLINNEREQRENYRERMADLSHGLKTPLSVLRGAESDVDDVGEPVSREVLLETLSKQVDRMTKLVDYQLQRAVPNVTPNGFSKVDINAAATDVISALDKVYASKSVVAEATIEKNIVFYGDENDLIELIGNLLDNAYKHGEQKVRFYASRVQSDSGRNDLVLMVEDDGMGVPLEKRATILQRGVRLDSTEDGQGFGLSIVTGIISSYKGKLSIEDSALGGAMFKIVIPTR